MSAPKPEPDVIPIFPLTGCLLLPSGQLPLNIFEPRYLAMTQDALLGSRLIGMVQPSGKRLPCGSPCVHEIGCAGKISEAIPTKDGRFLLELTGTQRFKIIEELSAARGYRTVRVQWLEESTEKPNIDRARLLPALRKYLQRRELDCDWARLPTCPDERLITLLAMLCPLKPTEQQALLEADGLATRAALLQGLIEMDELDAGTSPLN
jgi:uncharacterized protein